MRASTLFRSNRRVNRTPNWQFQRSCATAPKSGGGGLKWVIALGVVGGAAAYYYQNQQQVNDYFNPPKAIDYEAVRKDIAKSLNDPNYDDGSYGPVLVRLAWHAAGTYDKTSGTGGSDGATMRFEPESAHGANAGLHIARKVLDPIQAKYPGISHADLWILAGCVGIEKMGGPKVAFHPGRRDKASGQDCPPDGRLPNAALGPDHIREIFYRQGFNDQEIVALVGAHCLGRCHTDRSGYKGPWTHSPTRFTNDFFIQLLERKWTKKNWNGPEQFEDETGTLMMLPADLALTKDPEFRKWVKTYAEDEEKFFADFSKAFQKLLENGTKVCPVGHK